MKIVILDGYTANPGDISWDAVKALGDVICYERTPKEKTVERIGDADIILTNKVVITREIMEKCPKMKYVGVTATGYNIIDIGAANDLGVTVTNIPSYSTEAVAQHTFALLLEAAAHVGNHSKACFEGKWQNSPDFTFWDHPLFELSGKTLGIVGYGTIGKRVEEIAKAFGLTTLTYSRSGGKNTLDEIFRNSDIISLHCPLNDESAGMINRDTISKMKDGVIIINTARGGCVNEADTAMALECGKIAYYCADTVSKEPIEASNPLLNARNVILTPHIAWAAKETRERLIAITADNIKAYLDGKPINKVN